MTFRCIKFFILLFLFSCCQQGNHVKNIKIQRKRTGDQFVEGRFEGDSTLVGVAHFYSLKGVLTSKIEYSGGVKNGLAENYYSNGVVADSVYYTNGLENGKYFLFDSMGALKYTAFFFFGKGVGGREFYDYGKLSEYDFVSLDGMPLFSVDYNQMDVKSRYIGNIINLNMHVRLRKDEIVHALTVYLPTPPKIRIHYSLGLFKENPRELKTVANLSSQTMPFCDTVLSLPPKDWNYFIQADFFDSIDNFHKVHIQPIILTDKAQ
jgi:hypothetical protein